MRMVTNDCPRYEFDHLTQRSTSIKPSYRPKSKQSWRVLRFFGPNTERSDVLGVPLDACYASPGPRGADAKNPRKGCELEPERRYSRPSIDICIDYAA